MDTVKESQEITIGKYQCRVVKSNKWWCNNNASGTNEDIFKQFGITHLQIENLLGYSCQGSFPQCKSAEDLTKVIKFIMSKETKTVTNLGMFPTDGCFKLDGVHNDEIIKHLQSTRPIAGFSLESYQNTIAWNNSSYWGCQNSGKVEYNWEQLSKFVTTKKEVVREKQSDYVGRTIKALVKNPQGTDVQIGEEIKILKQTGSHYVLDKTAKGTPGMWINRPLYLHEWELLPEESVKKVEDSPVVDMKAIQEECKRRFPIGCIYRDPGDNVRVTRTLINDYNTYDIYGSYIYGHHGGGCLYKRGEYATLVSLPEEKTIKPKFIVGKWYKWDGADWYLKYSRSEGEHWWFSEAIKDGDYHFGQDWSHITNNHILVDVADIQQYLPDSHPEITFKSRFKIGDWIMWDGRTKGGPYKLTSISGTGFLDQNDDYRDTEDYHYRLATRSEISEKMLDRDIPEYVECISKDFYAIHLGRIYKLKPNSTSDNYLLKDVGMGSYSPCFFKPSTKEAYDAQFTKQEPIHVYGYDPYETIKTKPLIEDVQSVSVNLSTKRKINKFKN